MDNPHPSGQVGERWTEQAAKQTRVLVLMSQRAQTKYPPIRAIAEAVARVEQQLQIASLPRR